MNVYALAAALLTAITAAVAWRIRSSDRRAKRAELARDAATNRAEFAEATAETAVVMAERKAAAHTSTEPIRNVPSTGDPVSDVRAIDDAVRSHAHRTGADRGDTAAVRRRPATDPARGGHD